MKKMKFLLICVAMFATITCSCGCGCGTGTDINETPAGPTVSSSDELKDAEYISETICDPNSDMPAVLYDYKFQKTENYKSNIQLTNKMDSSEISEYLISAKNFLSTLFGNSYVSIEENPDPFISNVEKVLPDYMMEEKERTANALATELKDAYIENQMDCSVKFITDSSLIYKDYYIYIVRGSLDITLNSGSADGFYDVFGLTLKENDTVSILCEIGFAPNIPSKVVSFDLIAYIQN